MEDYPALAPDPLSAPAPQAFTDPNPSWQFTVSTGIAAKLVISEVLGMLLARLPEEEGNFIDAVVAETLGAVW